MPHVERDMNYHTRVMVITLHLACLLTRLLDHHSTTDEISKKIYKAIYNLVRLKVKAKSARTMLHLACCRDVAILGRYPACQFPSPHLAEVCMYALAKDKMFLTCSLHFPLLIQTICHRLMTRGIDPRIPNFGIP